MKKSYTNGFVEIAIQIHFKMINIPKQIEKFNFVLIQGQTKKPFEKEWHKKSIKNLIRIFKNILRKEIIMVFKVIILLLGINF